MENLEISTMDDYFTNSILASDNPHVICPKLKHVSQLVSSMQVDS